MSLSWRRIYWRCSNLLELIMRDLLSDIRRENFPDVAGKLMNHYCVLKKDSRYDGDLIFRFAEVEFYLYDASEQNVDVKTYSRDCLRGEWFFHSSGVDIAFDTVREGNELIRFGGILIRGVEVYREDEDGQWVQIGAIGGPKLSMYEMFNHALALPEIVALPDGFNTGRPIGAPTCRVGIDDDLRQRFVLADVDWNMPTERVVEVKEGDMYRVKIDKVKKQYNPKYKI